MCKERLAEICKNLQENLIQLELERRDENKSYYEKIKDFLHEIAEYVQLEINIEVYGGQSKPDLYIHRRKEELVAILEYKKLCNNEFNIRILEYENKKTLILCSEGKLEYSSNPQENNKFKNEDGDGIGQIRRYFYNLKNEHSSLNFAVFTNGFIWLFFEFNKNKNPVEQGISEEEIFFFILPHEINLFVDFLKTILQNSTIYRNDFMKNKKIKIITIS